MYLYFFQQTCSIFSQRGDGWAKNNILDVTGFLAGRQHYRLTTDPLNAFENNMGWPEIA
jgi:hypothetical protein